MAEEEQAEEIPGFAPLTPQIRPGHFDHIPESLVPEEADKEAVPRHRLERTSSIEFQDIETPSSTSDEEEGAVGTHFMCIGTVNHRINHKLHYEKFQNKMALQILVIVMVATLPAIAFQIIYVAVVPFRVYFLVNYDKTIVMLCSFTALAFALRYFTGLARKFPFHIIVITAKSLIWAYNYMLTGALVECVRVVILVGQDPRVGKVPNEQLYVEHAYGNATDQYHHDHKHENYHRWNTNGGFLYASVYQLLLLVILYILIQRYDKGQKYGITLFGPWYPFITYSLTSVIIILSTILFLGELLSSADEFTLWETIQASFGPILGCMLAEVVVTFFEELYQGRICPLQINEHFYAAAHY